MSTKLALSKFVNQTLEPWMEIEQLVFFVTSDPRLLIALIIIIYSLENLKKAGIKGDK